MSAPKNNVSRNVKFNDPGRSFTAAYMSDPMSRDEIVVPIMANVRIAPRFRKKYFCKMEKRAA